MPFRTMLFTPGNQARKVAKVFDAGADAVILDLEDAVAIAEKAATRATVVAALKARPTPRRPLGGSMRCRHPMLTAIFRR